MSGASKNVLSAVVLAMPPDARAFVGGFVGTFVGDRFRRRAEKGDRASRN